MSPRGWALLTAVSLLWGVTYLMLKVAGEELSPTALTFLRCVLAAAVLLPLARRGRTLPRLRRLLVPLVVMALLSVVIPFGTLAAGVNEVSTALASILGATTPILVVLLALPLDGGDRVGPVRAAGLALGLGGVVLLFGGELAGREELIGAALVMVSSVAYAAATVYYKVAFDGEDPVGVMAWTFLLSAVILAAPAAATAPARVPGADVLATVVALGLFSSGLVHVLYLTLIDIAGPARASVTLYTTPAVAVVLGVLVLGERLTAAVAAGLALVIVGARLSTGARVPIPDPEPSRP